MMTELKEEKAAVRDCGSASKAMLTVHDVAEMLNCSARTIYRLTDSGRIPRPVRLGSLVRWRRVIIEQWINQGCPRAVDMAVMS